MNAETSAPPKTAKQVDIQVKYDDLSAKYASQVLINSTREEIFLDFSAGAFNDQVAGKMILPINSRIVMTLPGARRLLQALGKALSTLEKLPAIISARTVSPDKKGEDDNNKASLPRI